MKRLICYGPESSGKSTLGMALSRKFSKPLVPEYGRSYFQHKMDRGEPQFSIDDVMPIARVQQRLQQEALQDQPWVICDTDLLQLAVYSQHYYNAVPDELVRMIRQQPAGHYLLCRPDTPWVGDDLRDRPDDREKLFALFEDGLVHYNQAYTVIHGNHEHRIKTASHIIASQFA